MANFHSHMKVITRSKGHSAVAAIAYRRAAIMKNEAENKSYDFGNKSEVVFSDISIPNDSPQWIKDISENDKGRDNKSSELLWNTVEQFEQRKNSQLAREIEFSLPVELTLEQNIELARNYIERNLVSRGMIVDWSFHNKVGNPHVHVMIPTRRADDNGFAEKVREWNDPKLTTHLREELANEINHALHKYGHDARVDYRSYEEQGIGLAPQVHLGSPEKIKKQNVAVEIKAIYADINAQNMDIIENNPDALLAKLNSQKSNFSNEDIANGLAKYSQMLQDSSTDNSHLFAVPSAEVKFLTKAKIAAILDRIEYHDSVFTVDKIESELKSVTANYKQLARAIVEIKNSDNVISLGFGDDGKERFTTANMLALERDIQTNVLKLQANVFSLLSDQAVSSALADYELMTGKQLTDEQDKAVRHIVGRESISCIVGRAGTGKSFSLAAAKAVWDASGNEIYGVALSGIAADGLVKDAGMDSRTIASFLLSVEAGSIKLTNNTVIVMDEAGMTDSFSMQKVVKLAEEFGSKLVLVGDPAQLQPVGPGASFRAILEKTGFAEIQTVYRQKEEWQRSATVEFSQGRVANGVQAYYDNGCVHMLNDATEAMSRLASDWQAMRISSDKDIGKYLVIAHRNSDVQSLNHALRDIRVSSGEIAEGYLVKNEVAGEEREIKLSQGDRIVFLRNYKELGLANGRFATVTYVNFSESGHVIDFNVKLDGNGKELTINPTSCNKFDYGYAATVHKTQGVTVDHSFVYGGGNLNSSLTYVAMTRHKETTGLYASLEQYKTVDELKSRVSRIEVKDSVLNYIDQVDDFAGRRGLETNQKTLKKIISDALGKARDRIIEVVTGHKVEQTAQIENVKITNIGDAQNKDNAPIVDQALSTELPVEQTQVSTEDAAKLVGEYVHIRRQVGMAYEALKPKLAMLGLDKISYEEKAFTVISQIPEYQDMQLFNLEQQRLAFEINSNLELSSRAIELNHINVDKLAVQAGRHEIRDRVEQYAKLKSRLRSQPTSANSNDVVVASDSSESDQYKRLAFEINRDIPGHYVALKEYEVDIAAVKSDFQQYILDIIARHGAANNKIESRFESFDSAVKEYLEFELKRVNIDKQLDNVITDELLSERALLKVDFAQYIKEFEAKFGEELKQSGGMDKAITISANGGFSEIYGRCLDNKLTENDFSAISRMVGYHQIQELVTTRGAFLSINAKMQEFREECVASGIRYSQTKEFSDALTARISYGKAASEVLGRFTEVERALNIYNIKPEQLERYSNGIINDYAVKAGLEYLKVLKTDVRRSYELAFEITKGSPEYVEKALGVDSKQIRSQVKELITAHVLSKHGFSELASKSPANAYADIVPLAVYKDSAINSEYKLQSGLVKFLETELVLKKLLHEVTFKDNRGLSDQFSKLCREVEQMKDNLRKTADFTETLSTKYDAEHYRKNPPSLTADLNFMYQRALCGKLVGEDYAVLKHHLDKNIGLQQQRTRGVSMKW